MQAFPGPCSYGLTVAGVERVSCLACVHRDKSAVMVHLNSYLFLPCARFYHVGILLQLVLLGWTA